MSCVGSAVSRILGEEDHGRPKSDSVMDIQSLCTQKIATKSGAAQAAASLAAMAERGQWKHE